MPHSPRFLVHSVGKTRSWGPGLGIGTSTWSCVLLVNGAVIYLWILVGTRGLQMLHSPRFQVRSVGKTRSWEPGLGIGTRIHSLKENISEVKIPTPQKFAANHHNIWIWWVYLVQSNAPKGCRWNDNYQRYWDPHICLFDKCLILTEYPLDRV